MWAIVYSGKKVWSAGDFDLHVLEELKNMGFIIKKTSKKQAKKIEQAMENGRARGILGVVKTHKKKKKVRDFLPEAYYPTRIRGIYGILD